MFQLRAYQTGDEARINVGFNRVFNRRRSLDEWFWKFDPRQRRSEIAVAVDQAGEIVAQYAATAVELHVDGGLYRAGQPVDVFCLPVSEARQQRLFVKTVLFFFSRFATPSCMPILYGFPGDRALRLGRSKLGYEHYRPVRAWQRPLRGTGWAWPTRSRGRAEARFRLCHEPEPDAVDELWRRCATRYPVAIVRDAAWLERRFFSHPETRYRYFGLREEGMLRAWAIVRLEGANARWVDLLWDGEDPEVLTALQEHLARFARRRRARRFEFWVGGDASTEALLEALGWTSGEGPPLPHLAVRSFAPEVDGAWLLEHFYYTLADTDLV